MYEDFILIERSGKHERAKRIFLGDVKGKDEHWLRNTLFDHPEILPIDEIDSAYGPLVPLCKELRTDAGPIDAVFINEHGRLTIVECKLWKNPEARRQVVAQALHYVSALAEWSYSDLQREVSKAAHERGNFPFEVVRERANAKLAEKTFVDAASRSLREGRFLVLIAGDGIQAGVQSIAELLYRNATKAFSFGLVEVAMYQRADDQLIIQPRVLAQTELFERQVTVLEANSKYQLIGEDLEETDTPPLGSKIDLKAWWQTILDMKFDDPDQEPPLWTTPNNVVLRTPFPEVQIKAFANKHSKIGVFLSGRLGPNSFKPIRKLIERHRVSLKSELPTGTEVDSEGYWPIAIYTSEFEYDNDKRAWIMKMLNEFVNVLRPRLKKWQTEIGG